MCLTVPRRVELVNGDMALLQDGRWVKTIMVPSIKKGDMVLVQADMIVETITKQQAKEMKKAMEE